MVIFSGRILFCNDLNLSGLSRHNTLRDDDAAAAAAAAGDDDSGREVKHFDGCTVDDRMANECGAVGGLWIGRGN